MSIYMATTGIAPEKTSGEIMKLLSNYAENVQVKYEKGIMTGLAFSMMVGGHEAFFKLPVRWQEVYVLLNNDKRLPRQYKNPEQAVRVAWRQIFRWVQAQIALIESEMVKPEEVFLPYYMDRSGKTLFESIEKKGFPQIGYEKS